MTRRKAKPLSHRAALKRIKELEALKRNKELEALKRIKELEATIKELRTEERDRRSALLDALGIPQDFGEIFARLEDLEARFW